MTKLSKTIEEVTGDFCPHCDEEIDPTNLAVAATCSRCGNQEVFHDGERPRCSDCNVFMAKDGAACPECEQEIDPSEIEELTKYRTSDGTLHDTLEEAEEWVANEPERQRRAVEREAEMRQRAEARARQREEFAKRYRAAYEAASVPIASIDELVAYYTNQGAEFAINEAVFGDGACPMLTVDEVKAVCGVTTTIACEAIIREVERRIEQRIGRQLQVCGPSRHSLDWGGAHGVPANVLVELLEEIIRRR